MTQAEVFAVVAIPLSRPDIVEFLIPPRPTPRGTKLQIVGQRPTPQAEANWIEQLAAIDNPAVSDLLAMDDPHVHLVETYTDRLVPLESLAQPNFLTRDLGGWVANYFGPVGLPKKPWSDDPLLNHLAILTEYGTQIRYLGADPALVAARLGEETERDAAEVAAALGRLHALRHELVDQPTSYIERIYAEIADETYLATGREPPIPPALLYDELVGQMVRLELQRRAMLAQGNERAAASIKAWQVDHEQQSGLRLILQGEYIVGRHRRSTVLIAPELGVVIKQPAPEPFHDIELGAKFVHGRNENWPVTTNGGALVTSRGRIRLTLEENIVPRLNRVFNHNVRFSALLGLSIEPFVVGQTVQDFVLADHSRLTPNLYEAIMLHQQVCELLEIDNNDWHAPNFVRRDGDGEIVHIDWGAARPLSPAELTPEDRLARLNQVRNMAFSFKDPDLAERLTAIHTELVADESRMERLRRQAQAIVAV